jgi:hypothetical protein
MKPQNSPPTCFSELDPREGNSPLPEGNISLSFSAETPSEVSETALTRGVNSKAPFFFSALIHLVALSLLLGVMYQPDKKPITKVNHWVVNLVTALKEEPKGPKSVTTEDRKLPAGAILPPPAKAAPVPREKKISWNESAPLQEFPEASEPLPERSEQQTRPTPASPEVKKVEHSFQIMQESVNNQVQAGQYLFGMKMGDQMMPLKIKYFQKNVKDHVFALLRTTISEEMTRTLQDQSALIEISYHEDGSVQNILFSSDSHGDLPDLIKDVEWKSLTSPIQFGLPFKVVKIRIAVDSQNRINVNLSSL